MVDMTMEIHLTTILSQVICNDGGVALITLKYKWLRTQLLLNTHDVNSTALGDVENFEYCTWVFKRIQGLAS